MHRQTFFFKFQIFATPAIGQSQINEICFPSSFISLHRVPYITRYTLTFD